MLCENEECGKTAIQKGRHVKSRRPYIATVYYRCPHCGASFSIDSSLGEISVPDNPESVMRLVVSKLAQLPKEKLMAVSRIIRQIS